jgi:hypothetical protein
MALSPGASLQAGRYTIQTTLYTDDYCTTYRAVQHDSEAWVALQVLNPMVGSEPATEGTDESPENESPGTMHPLQQEFLATAIDRAAQPSPEFPPVFPSGLFPV